MFYIASKLRNYYLQQLSEELKEYRSIACLRNIAITEESEKWSVATDWQSAFDKKYTGPSGQPSAATQLYRQDIVLLKGGQSVEDIMCWPVVSGIDEEHVTEDFPVLPACMETINNTVIMINSFPWFCCDIRFYPSAEPVKGLIDYWFQKWYNPVDDAYSLFLNVVHIITGPYREDGCEVYTVDFGTAPAEAFCELIKLCSIEGIERIVVN